MQNVKNDEIKQAVRANYGEIARASETSSPTGCCATSCCAPESKPTSLESTTIASGYSTDDVSSLPEGVNLGLGFGNPQAIANLKEGETVLYRD
jgi:arsenite methyltransferase